MSTGVVFWNVDKASGTGPFASSPGAQCSNDLAAASHGVGQICVVGLSVASALSMKKWAKGIVDEAMMIGEAASARRAARIDPITALREE
jgi:hypothetical protein